MFRYHCTFRLQGKRNIGIKNQLLKEQRSYCRLKDLINNSSPLSVYFVHFVGAINYVHFLIRLGRVIETL